MPPSPAESVTGWVLRQPSRFGSITVRARKDGTRSYHQKGGNQSTVDRHGISIDTYIHALYGLALQRAGRKTLMIGCAGGTLATMLTRAGFDVTAVDIEKAAFTLARRYFGLPKCVQCHAADGLKHLKATRRRYDLVIIDAFIGEKIPEHLLGDDVFGLIKKRTRPNGLVLVNVCLNDRRDRAADSVAHGFAAHDWATRLLDERGGARNAVVAAGNVKGLRKPRVRCAPEVGADELKKALGAMRFRPVRRPRSSR